MFGAFSLLSIFVLVLCTMLAPRLLGFRHGRADRKPTGVFSDRSAVCGRSEKPFRLRMALRKPDQPWLLIDEHYLKEHSIRKTLFERKGEKILGCKPVALPACRELLKTVADELTGTYPDRFRFLEPTEASPKIEIIETGECFDLEGQATDTEELRTAATLASEDFNIIIRDDRTGKHRIQASASCFPVGWSVNERLSWPVSAIHAAVPRWQQQLQSSVERFFGGLSTRTMERIGEFVQVADLDRDDLGEVLCHTGAVGQVRPEQPKNIIIRTERQTFRRLPRTQAIVFAVRTWVRTLPELADHELAKFQREMHSWPDDVAEYKGRGIWGGTVDAYCAWRLH